MELPIEEVQRRNAFFFLRDFHYLLDSDDLGKTTNYDIGVQFDRAEKMIRGTSTLMESCYHSSVYPPKWIYNSALTQLWPLSEGAVLLSVFENIH